MHEVGILAVRGLAGGALVVAFALVSELVKPKAFAGLFASAPSVAIASLAITVIAESAKKAQDASMGMVIGGVAMVAGCVVAVGVIPRLHAFGGSLLAIAGWTIAALGLYFGVFIGGR
jgi:Protein of unknown function (DUF3147)